MLQMMPLRHYYSASAIAAFALFRFCYDAAAVDAVTPRPLMLLMLYAAAVEIDA